MFLSFTLCTIAFNRDVGQEGIGEAYQMQVCNCAMMGAVLVLAKPQKLLGILEEDFNVPALAIDLDDF